MRLTLEGVGKAVWVINSPILYHNLLVILQGHLSSLNIVMTLFLLALPPPNMLQSTITFSRERERVREKMGAELH